MATRAEVIKLIEAEFDRFINGHSHVGMSAVRVFEAIRPHIALAGEPVDVTAPSYSVERKHYRGELFIAAEDGEVGEIRVGSLRRLPPA